MEEIILMICTAGIYLPTLGETQSEEICLNFTLSPQYAMTQEEIDGKIIYICEQAHQSAAEHQGYVTRCEVIDLDVEVPNISYNFSM